MAEVCKNKILFTQLNIVATYFSFCLRMLTVELKHQNMKFMIMPPIRALTRLTKCRELIEPNKLCPDWK